MKNEFKTYSLDHTFKSPKI